MKHWFFTWRRIQISIMNFNKLYHVDDVISHVTFSQQKSTSTSMINVKKKQVLEPQFRTVLGFRMRSLQGTLFGCHLSIWVSLIHVWVSLIHFAGCHMQHPLLTLAIVLPSHAQTWTPYQTRQTFTFIPCCSNIRRTNNIWNIWKEHMTTFINTYIHMYVVGQNCDFPQN